MSLHSVILNTGGNHILLIDQVRGWFSLDYRRWPSLVAPADEVLFDEHLIDAPAIVKPDGSENPQLITAIVPRDDGQYLVKTQQSVLDFTITPSEYAAVWEAVGRRRPHRRE